MVRCTYCRRKGSFIKCVYCENIYCSKCIQPEIHECTKLSDKKISTEKPKRSHGFDITGGNAY